MILHNGGNVCAYVSFHNRLIYAHKSPREEKGGIANEEQNWIRICPLIHSSGWFYRISIDE